MLANAVGTAVIDPTKLVAVPDAMKDVAGVMLWWRLSGEVEWDALSQAWNGAGLDPTKLPGETTPRAALGVAVKGQENAERRAVRLSDETGWALISTAAKWDETTTTTELRVRLPKGGHARLEFDNPNHPLAGFIQSDWEKARRHIDQNSFGAWLVRRAQDCRAVALRDTGGIYFIPRQYVELWNSTIDIVKLVTKHLIFQVPALRSDQAVEAILDAVRQEAQGAIGLITGEVAGGKLGRRALENRGANCEALLGKLSTYEKLLGTALTDLKERAEGLRAEAIAASLLAGGKEEGT